jgi:hypothetical protein
MRVVPQAADFFPPYVARMSRRAAATCGGTLKTQEKCGGPRDMKNGGFAARRFPISVVLSAI